MKRCAISIWKDVQNHYIREIQTRTTRYHFTPVRMAEQKIGSVGKDGEKLGCYVKSCSHYGRRSSNSSKKLKIELSHDLQFHFWVRTGKSWKQSLKMICIIPTFYSSIIYNSKNVEATQGSISRWVGKQNVVNGAVQCYSVIKRMNILAHTTEWVKLEDIMLGEISQSATRR